MCAVVCWLGCVQSCLDGHVAVLSYLLLCWVVCGLAGRPHVVEQVMRIATDVLVGIGVCRDMHAEVLRY